MATEPRPARAVVLPADPDVPVTVETVDGSLPGLWALLGGQPEVVSLGEGVRAVLWCHGYGKRERLPGNGRATRFVDGFLPGFARGDTIAGTAVVVGFDDEGLAADVPDDVLGAALGI